MGLRETLASDGWCFGYEWHDRVGFFTHFQHPTEGWRLILPPSFDDFDQGKYSLEQQDEFLALLRRLFKERFGHGVTPCDLPEEKLHRFVYDFGEVWVERLKEHRASRKWWNPFS